MAIVSGTPSPRPTPKAIGSAELMLESLPFVPFEPLAPLLPLAPFAPFDPLEPLLPLELLADTLVDCEFPVPVAAIDAAPDALEEPVLGLPVVIVVAPPVAAVVVIVVPTPAAAAAAAVVVCAEAAPVAASETPCFAAQHVELP